MPDQGSRVPPRVVSVGEEEKDEAPPRSRRTSQSLPLPWEVPCGGGTRFPVSDLQGTVSRLHTFTLLGTGVSVYLLTFLLTYLLTLCNPLVSVNVTTLPRLRP